MDVVKVELDAAQLAQRVLSGPGPGPGPGSGEGQQRRQLGLILGVIPRLDALGRVLFRGRAEAEDGSQDGADRGDAKVVADTDGGLRKLSQKAISYYASGSDDESTKVGNGAVFRSILLTPRVFADCSRCSLSTNILGIPVGMPVYVSPAAMAKLAHASGEVGIAAACSRFRGLQIISKNASMSPSAIVQARPHAQLYVLKGIEATERTLAQIRAIPQIKFIVLTLDAPFPGKREADERFKMAEVAGGAASQSGLTWQKALEWLIKQTSLPIVLKGIQTHEGAYAATIFPSMKGIVISNHGGRALDTTMTPVQVLIDILIDGGVRRGTDVVKALALGAKGVGIGRAALYGLAVGGQAGVERALQILGDEIVTSMRLLGVERVDQLGPRHMNMVGLHSRLYGGPPGLEETDAELRYKL
ncbi:FMN-dependent dehydrogenase [Colletotrichum navitas]|uniref:FMN-dependent dehydrogenase n=1 Tax=Colletotrichum navitas TaxID=681940 RepID=A0AAD8Q126_9PEZI|nr:FMN-dependent dehydrogenase [Colletotrichum navitas]KAK1593902.1 FMN-dependent dehydrogenase [Colletotrichum navitas]